MKKVFIFFVAMGFLSCASRGFALSVDIENGARSTLINLLAEQNSKAIQYYDEYFKGKYDVDVYVGFMGTPSRLNPLTVAIFHDYKDGFDWLLPEANPLAINDLGETPLDYAAASSNPYYLKKLTGKILLKNINTPDSLGRLPIHYAVQAGREEAIIPLLDKGTNLNAQDNEGDTPLHLLIRKYKETANNNLIQAIVILPFISDAISGAYADASLIIPNKREEIPFLMFDFEAEIDELIASGTLKDKALIAKIKAKIADAKAKVAGLKPDPDKKSDKQLIDALNTLQQGLVGLVNKL